MAIVIPSSKTYDRQNPKVRDNVIERIEVGAVEVVPDNNYETPVYNKNIDFNPTDLTNTPIENKDLQALMFYVSQSGVTGRIYSVSYAGYNNQKTLNVDIKIPVISNNKFINKIYTLLNKDEEPYIKYSIIGNKKTGIANASWNYSATDKISTSPYEFTVEEGKIKYNTPYNIEEDIVGMEFEKEISWVENENEPTIGTMVKQKLKEWGNIKTAKAIIETIGEKEYYVLSLQIMAGVTSVGMGYSKYANDGSTPSKIDLEGIYVSYEATSVEITIYGNTIGIDLQDKTDYINGETAKKVHSIDGNELMQTANYIVDKNGTKAKAIDKMYGDTQTDYAKGKETAKIRCSISDYYDGGQKVISIDNSTGKMSFDIGDQVIPMVYGADGKDRPMSTYQDGFPKEFEVLGKEKFYDGAVWQELYLQEA